MKKISAVLSLGVLLLLSNLAGTAAAQSPTTVTVRLVDTLSSGSSQPGDVFTGTLATPLVVNGRIVAGQNARIIGQVGQVVSSGRLKRPALIVLRLNKLEAGSRGVPLQTGDLEVKADSHAKRNLLIIGGTAAAGAVMGGAAGGGKGAAIGAVAGAGAGTAGAYLTGKQEIVLPSETVLTFHVNSVSISSNELARLQRATPEAESAQRPPEALGSDMQTVVLRRYRYEDDEDHDDQGEDENEHEYEREDEYGHEHRHEHEHRAGRPRSIDVVFLSGHRAEVVIQWSSRTEQLMLRGDDLDDILEPLSQRSRISVEFLRPRVRVIHED